MRMQIIVICLIVLLFNFSYQTTMATKLRKVVEVRINFNSKLGSMKIFNLNQEVRQTLNSKLGRKN